MAYKHVQNIDLFGNGIEYEVVVIKEDTIGNIHFIKVEDLDAIDRQRILGILRKRDSSRYPFWDLLDSTTLRNGQNALQYFHQLVKVKTPQGQIMTPSQYKQGAAVRKSVKKKVDPTKSDTE